MCNKINCIGEKVICPYCKKQFEINYAEKIYISPKDYKCEFPNLNSLEYKLLVICPYCVKGAGEVDKNGDFVLDSEEFVEFMKQKEIELFEKHRKMYHYGSIIKGEEK